MATSAGVIKDYIAALADGEVATLDQLHAAVVAAGITKELAQIYADVQSLASRRAIGRGTESRTYCKFDGEAPVRQPRAEGDAPAKPRKVKATGRYTDAEVLAGLEAELGPAVLRSKTADAFCAVLLGEWSPAFLLERAETVLKTKPAAWFTFNQGENTAVGFYPAT